MCGDANARLVPLTVPTIAAFVQTRTGGLSQSSRRSPATATRAFLRFLATCGVVPARIEGAVPTIREWKHAGLPRALALTTCSGCWPRWTRHAAAGVVIVPSCCF